LDGLNATNIVQIPGKLTVGCVFGEARLRDEVTGLFVQVLLQVASNDNVHKSSLASGVQVKAAAFVGFEDLGADLGQHVVFLIGDSHKVDCLCLERVDCASIYKV
jgi:hypothetical protein